MAVAMCQSVGYVVFIQVRNDYGFPMQRIYSRILSSAVNDVSRALVQMPTHSRGHHHEFRVPNTPAFGNASTSTVNDTPITPPKSQLCTTIFF